VLIGVLAAVMIPIVIAIVIATTTKRTADRATTDRPPPPSPSPSTPAVDQHPPVWQGTDGIILVDRAGTQDVIGRSRRVNKGDEVRAIALDGLTGKPRWESEVLGTYDDTYLGKLVVAGDLVLFASQRAELRALALATGAAKWQTKLDERIAYLCDGGPDVLIAVGTDDVKRAIKRSDGTVTTVPAEPKGAASARGKRGELCMALPDDDTSWTAAADRRDSQLDKTLEVSSSGSLPAPGGRIVWATRAKGTRVPTLIAVDDKNAERWRVDVPTDPLGALANAPEHVTVGDRAVCCIYQTATGDLPLHAACFVLADGRRLWDAGVGTHSLRMLRASAGALYTSSSGVVAKFDIETGAKLWTFGR